MSRKSTAKGMKKSGKRAGRKRERGEYLSTRAYRSLRQMIIVGIYRPGEHLKEENLVRVLGVSRSVVRQVLVQLVSDGLLIDEPKKGKTVAEFTEETLAKLLPIRICLEQLAVRKAISRLTKEDADELKRMAAGLLDPQLTLSEQDALDMALHRKIWSIAGNDELEKVLNLVVGPFHLMSNAVLVSPLYKRNTSAISWQKVIMEREREAGGHQQLIEAICRRDAKAAVRAVEDHLTVNYATSPDEFGRKIASIMHKYWHHDGES